MAQELVDITSQIVRNRLPDFDITSIQDDDVETLTLLCEGDTKSILWFCDPEKQSYLKKLNPKSFNDLLVFNTLYKPSSSGSMSDLEKYIGQERHLEPEV